MNLPNVLMGVSIICIIVGIILAVVVEPRNIGIITFATGMFFAVVVQIWFHYVDIKTADFEALPEDAE